LSDEPTPSEERDSFFRQLLAGAHLHCPTCERRARVRGRKLNAGMAWMLIKLYSYTVKEKPKDGWIHVTKLFLTYKRNAVAAEYPKLEYWGLIQPLPNDDLEKRGSGFWRVTDKGVQFVLGELRLPRRAFVAEPGFDARVLGFDDEKTTSIREALADKFDYEELMARARVPARQIQ
jgi:hypothetical protein